MHLRSIRGTTQGDQRGSRYRNTYCPYYKHYFPAIVLCPVISLVYKVCVSFPSTGKNTFILGTVFYQISLELFTLLTSSAVRILASA